jgi:hypothetical protein
MILIAIVCSSTTYETLISLLRMPTLTAHFSFSGSSLMLFSFHSATPCKLLATMMGEMYFAVQDSTANEVWRERMSR